MPQTKKLADCGKMPAALEDKLKDVQMVHGALMFNEPALDNFVYKPLQAYTVK